MNETAYLNRISAPTGNPIKIGSAHDFIVKHKPMSAAWKRDLATGSQFWFSGHPDFGQSVELANGREFQMKLWDLQRGLVAMGGEETCLPAIEDDLDIILERGQLWPGKAQMRKMEPGRCHENAASLWNENPGRLLIATGYALSNDGMWRQHSWCIAPALKQKKVIETTLPRELYFGAVLTLAETIRFCENASWHSPRPTPELRALYQPDGIVDRDQPNSQEAAAPHDAAPTEQPRQRA